MGKLTLLVNCFSIKFTKKVKASSLTETIVATVIILIVFAIAFTSVNNVLENFVKNDTTAVEYKLNELMYQNKHSKLKTPTSIDYNNWNIEIEKEEISGVSFIEFKAIHKETKKVVVKKIISK